MVFRYFTEEDMLYIELVAAVTTESEEVAPGVVLDFDKTNRVIGIEIEDASKAINLERLELSALPIVDLVMSKESPVPV